MKDIVIQTFSKWSQSVSIFGSHTTPVHLLVRVLNNKNKKFIIRSVCVSTKTDYWLFEISNDILHNTRTFIVNSNSNFDYEIDVRHIIENYSRNKKFTIKITGDTGTYESEKMTVSDIQNIKSMYS